MAKYVFASVSTWVTPTIYINRGEMWDGNDPIVLSNPQYFDVNPSPYARRTVEEPPEPVVEKATAAPGEKRTVNRVK